MCPILNIMTCEQLTIYTYPMDCVEMGIITMTWTRVENIEFGIMVVATLIFWNQQWYERVAKVQRNAVQGIFRQLKSNNYLSWT